MQQKYPDGLRKEIIDIIESWKKTCHDKNAAITESKLLDGEYDIVFSIKREITLNKYRVLVNKFRKHHEDVFGEAIFYTFAQNSKFASCEFDVHRLKEFLKKVDADFNNMLNDEIQGLYEMVKDTHTY